QSFLSRIPPWTINYAQHALTIQGNIAEPGSALKPPAAGVTTAGSPHAPDSAASTTQALSNGIEAERRKDYLSAMRWYRIAADQGDARAQDAVGHLYVHGWGVSANYPEAMRWYKMAAGQGNVSAQTDIGLLYFNGLGIPRDHAEAMRWYRLAADQGY